MITKNDDLLGSLIHDVAYLLRHEIDDRLKPYNLTRVKWLALGVIDRKGFLSQSELAEALELGAASVGRLVDRLEEREFVIRIPNPSDRRSYQLSLTPEAKNLITELESVRDELGNETLSVLNPSEVFSLKRGLSKLKDKLQDATVGAGLLSFFAIDKFAPSATALGEFAILI